MCACEPGFTCSRCAGTPFDPRYEEDTYEPISEQEFEQLTREPFAITWEGWV